MKEEEIEKAIFLDFVRLEASHFSSPDIPKRRSYSDHLPETLTEDGHFTDTG